MNGNAVKRRRREKLMRESPRCYWCGCRVVPPPEGRPRYWTPRNTATLDHLRSRLDPDRGKLANGEEQTVLACLECNHRRGVAEVAKLSLAEQRRRAALPGKRLYRAFADVVEKAKARGGPSARSPGSGV